MKKITIENLKTGKKFIGYEQDFTSEQDFIDWRNDRILDNSWGLPERWLPDYLEGVETREVASEIEGEAFTEYLHPADYTIEIVDITEQYNKEQTIAATITEGKKARAACEEVLAYVTGYNVARAFTAEQVNSFQSTFATIFNLLLSGRPNSAKLSIEGVAVDGTIVTDELKSNALAILVKYGYIE